MDEKAKIYFWPYDIFGYLLPGLVLLALCARANSWAYDVYAQYWHGGAWQNVVVIIGFAYVVGHIIAAASSLVVERVLLKHTLGWPTQRLFAREAPSHRFAKLVLWFVPGYERAYSADFQRLVLRELERQFGAASEDFHDWFWLAWSQVSMSHPAAFRRATHFLELYGFSRNLCMALFLSAFLPLLESWTNPITPKIVWIVLCLLGAGLLFANYAKLLRRLNDETFRAFVVVSRPEE